jgi:hypothetical protein
MENDENLDENTSCERKGGPTIIAFRGFQNRPVCVPQLLVQKVSGWRPLDKAPTLPSRHRRRGITALERLRKFSRGYQGVFPA